MGARQRSSLRSKARVETLPEPRAFPGVYEQNHFESYTARQPRRISLQVMTLDMGKLPRVAKRQLHACHEFYIGESHEDPAALDATN